MSFYSPKCSSRSKRTHGCSKTIRSSERNRIPVNRKQVFFFVNNVAHLKINSNLLTPTKLECWLVRSKMNIEKS